MPASYALWLAAICTGTIAVAVFSHRSGRRYFLTELERRRRNRLTAAALLAGVTLLLIVMGWDVR